MELSDVPEPVMAQFDRLPLPMQMRVAARVLQQVNQRDLGEHLGIWWPTQLWKYAEKFEREDHDAKVIAAGLADGLDQT